MENGNFLFLPFRGDMLLKVLGEENFKGLADFDENIFPP